VELPAELDTTVNGIPAICVAFDNVPDPVMVPAVVDLAIVVIVFPLFETVILPAVVSNDEMNMPVMVQFNGTIDATDTAVVPLVFTAHMEHFGAFDICE
jgi:hypothetical protein